MSQFYKATQLLSCRTGFHSNGQPHSKGPIWMHEKNNVTNIFKLNLHHNPVISVIIHTLQMKKLGLFVTVKDASLGSGRMNLFGLELSVCMLCNVFVII